LVDIREYALPTNLQNFMHKDLTEVKTFQKVLRGYFFSETPCSCNCPPPRVWQICVSWWCTYYQPVV